ncbi:MAG TPA: hypothetical protein VGF93_21135 [Solirubrobacteraceae bacterium]
MHDDSQLELLERDLQRLAKPSDDDERVRSAIRKQLVTRAAPRPRPRRSMRIALGTAAVAAATAAIAVVTGVGPSGSGGPSVADAAVIHHALAAVASPANSILHEQLVGVQNGVPVEAEWWQQTSPPYASRLIKGPVGHEGEVSDNGVTSFAYDARTNTITAQRDSSPPTPIDPVSEARQELASGQARVAGTVLIGGSSLYKIDLPHGLVGYFDTNDYRPRYMDDPQRDGSVVRVRVVTYEYLPMTASSRTLLSVTAQHPAARIVAGSNSGSSK